MGEVTGISWCDHTWNPVIGCTRVSPACDGCYAAALMGTEGRLKVAEWGEPGKGAGTRVRTTPGTFNAPLKWDRKAARDEVVRFVFVASLSDWADNEWPIEWLRETFGIIGSTPNLRYLMLTKRPQLIVKRFRAAMGDLPWPSNAFAGTTVEDRKRVVNIAHLLAAQSALRIPCTFLSCEPLLEDLGDINWALTRNPVEMAAGFLRHGMFSPGMETLRPIGWVITGGETDQGKHKARPTHPDWLRAIRDACAHAGVPYHHKQNGEWIDHRQQHAGLMMATVPDRIEVRIEHDTVFEKRGKKHTGRLIDGVLHDAMPEV